jgi:predicted branched-subunit amino acid permease
MTLRADILAGARRGAPLLPPIFTFGVVTGIAATAAGFSPVQTVGMGLLFYSPVSTITTVELLAAGTPAAIVLVTALSVVAHFTVLSLSIAPYFEHLSTGRKWLLAYFLNTPSYALSVDRYEADADTGIVGFYLGVGGSLWATWQAALGVGLAFGAGSRPGWQLDFVIPLVFIALLGDAVESTRALLVAVVAGVVSVAGGGLPLNAGVLVAAVAGLCAGVLAQRTGVGA